jgi:hypothetical protein
VCVCVGGGVRPARQWRCRRGTGNSRTTHMLQRRRQRHRWEAEDLRWTFLCAAPSLNLTSHQRIAMPNQDPKSGPCIRFLTQSCPNHAVTLGRDSNTSLYYESISGQQNEWQLYSHEDWYMRYQPA